MRLLSASDPEYDNNSIRSFGLVRLTDSNMNSSGDSEHLLAVAAVHGLNGDAYMTWTHTNATFWLRDYLSTFLTSCRVPIYGYPSKILPIPMVKSPVMRLTCSAPCGISATTKEITMKIYIPSLFVQRQLICSRPPTLGHISLQADIL